MLDPPVHSPVYSFNSQWCFENPCKPPLFHEAIPSLLTTVVAPQSPPAPQCDVGSTQHSLLQAWSLHFHGAPLTHPSVLGAKTEIPVLNE